MKIFSENIWQSVLLVCICALTSLDLCVCVGGGIALSIALDKRRGFFCFVFEPGIKKNHDTFDVVLIRTGFAQA